MQIDPRKILKIRSTISTDEVVSLLLSNKGKGYPVYMVGDFKNNVKKYNKSGKSKSKNKKEK